MVWYSFVKSELSVDLEQLGIVGSVCRNVDVVVVVRGNGRHGEGDVLVETTWLLILLSLRQRKMVHIGVSGVKLAKENELIEFDGLHPDASENKMLNDIGLRRVGVTVRLRRVHDEHLLVNAVSLIKHHSVAHASVGLPVQAQQILDVFVKLLLGEFLLGLAKHVRHVRLVEARRVEVELLERLQV